MQSILKVAALSAAALVGIMVIPAIAEEGSATPACATQKECTVVRKKVIGYRTKTVRVPIYRRIVEQRKEPCDDCTPEIVQPQGTKIPTPPPKIVEVEQEIIVVTKPKITYAPVPAIEVGPAPPVVFEEPRVMRVQPPPPPQINRAPPCNPCARPAPLRKQSCGGSDCFTPAPGTRTDEGYLVHEAGIAPPGSDECWVSQGGRMVKGKCW